MRFSWPLALTQMVVATVAAGMVWPERTYAQSPPTEQNWLVRDSAGIEVVLNRSPAWTGAAQGVDPSPSLQIGSLDGDVPYLFQRIRQVLALPDGRVAVVDRGGAEIRVFDSDGQWLRTIGRQGQGPGEFAAAPTIALAPPDTIVALDASAGRFSRFLLDGTLLADQRISPAGGVSGPGVGSGGMPGAVLPTGETVSMGGVWEEVDHPGRDVTVRDLQYAVTLLPGPDATPVPLGSHPSSRVLYSDAGSASDPFAPTTGLALDGPPPTLTLMDTPRWEITELSMTGDTTRIVRVDLPRIPVTDDVVAQHREQLRERARAAGRDPGLEVRAFNQFSPPDSAPALVGVYSDGRGTRFLHRWSPDGDRGGARLEVVDPSGRWLGSLTLPPDAGRIVGVGRGRIFTEWRDALDVPYVRVYQIN